MVESTKRHGNINGRDVKIKLFLPQPKASKIDGRVVREMIVKTAYSICPMQKSVFIITYS